jgi:hypothetical protein
MIRELDIIVRNAKDGMTGKDEIARMLNGSISCEAYRPRLATVSTAVMKL